MYEGDPLAVTGATGVLVAGELAHTGVGAALWWVAAMLLFLGVLAIATARLMARRDAGR